MCGGGEKCGEFFTKIRCKSLTLQLNFIITLRIMVDIKQSMREILAAESRAIESIPVTDDYVEEIL